MAYSVIFKYDFFCYLINLVPGLFIIATQSSLVSEFICLELFKKKKKIISLSLKSVNFFHMILYATKPNWDTLHQNSMHTEIKSLFTTG